VLALKLMSNITFGADSAAEMLDVKPTTPAAQIKNMDITV